MYWVGKSIDIGKLRISTRTRWETMCEWQNATFAHIFHVKGQVEGIGYTHSCQQLYPCHIHHPVMYQISTNRSKRSTDTDLRNIWISKWLRSLICKSLIYPTLRIFLYFRGNTNENITIWHIFAKIPFDQRAKTTRHVSPAVWVWQWHYTGVNSEKWSSEQDLHNISQNIVI